jgi:hypothetical protein
MSQDGVSKKQLGHVQFVMIVDNIGPLLDLEKLFLSSN